MKNVCEITLRFDIRDIDLENIVSPSDTSLNTGYFVIVNSKISSDDGILSGKVEIDILKTEKRHSSYEKFRKNIKRFYQLPLFPEF